MPWVKRQKPPHECNRPALLWRSARNGDQWQCRKCGSIWELESQDHYGNTWLRVSKPRKS